MQRLSQPSPPPTIRETAQGNGLRLTAPGTSTQPHLGQTAQLPTKKENGDRAVKSSASGPPKSCHCCPAETDPSPSIQPCHGWPLPPLPVKAAAQDSGLQDGGGGVVWQATLGRCGDNGGRAFMGWPSRKESVGHGCLAWVMVLTGLSSQTWPESA